MLERSTSGKAKAAEGDVESGPRELYPSMQERPELRWAFIRKVYVILSLQLAMTVAVGAVVVSVKPISHFFASSRAGLAVYIVVVLLSLILMFPLFYYRLRHPVNLILLSLFTASLSFTVGLACSLSRGKVVLEAVILTTIVVLSLTVYTFWAARRGHDFKFLGPFLFAALLVLLVFGLIQIFFPLGKLGVVVYGGLGAIVFSGFIIYDTDNLIKRCSYDEYIWASVSLYLDIVNLFLSLLSLLDS